MTANTSKHLGNSVLGETRGGFEGVINTVLDMRGGIGSGKMGGTCVESLLLYL